MFISSPPRAAPSHGSLTSLTAGRRTVMPPFFSSDTPPTERRHKVPERAQRRITGVLRRSLGSRSAFGPAVLVLTVGLWPTDRGHGLPTAVVALLPAIAYTATGVLDQINIDTSMARSGTFSSSSAEGLALGGAEGGSRPNFGAGRAPAGALRAHRARRGCLRTILCRTPPCPTC